MTTTGGRWQSYWADKATPQYAHEHVDHYRAYANELRLLFADPAHMKVLEIGCGNGALYGHLGFDKSGHYSGVDFSERMLGVFRQNYPGVHLVYAEGAAYQTDKAFDLIFSSQVAQYWNSSQLAEHIGHATEMLAPNGVIVISGIPWSRMRLAYARGDLTGGKRRSLPCSVLGVASELVRKRLGSWYDHQDIRRHAAANGLGVDFYGSMHYAYRFHAVLRKNHHRAVVRPPKESWVFDGVGRDACAEPHIN